MTFRNSALIHKPDEIPILRQSRAAADSALVFSNDLTLNAKTERPLLSNDKIPFAHPRLGILSGILTYFSKRREVNSNLMIKLSNPQFYVTILNRRDPKITISYHQAVRKDVGVAEHLKHIMGSSYNICHTLDLPIFFKSGNTHELVSRYWLLSYILDRDITAFPAIVFEDKSLIVDVLACEDFFLTLFKRRTSPARNCTNYLIQSGKPTILASSEDSTRKSLSDATESRQKSRESGRICPRPDCNGALLKSIGKNKLKDKSDVYDAYKVTCYYKSIKTNPCHFHALLTKYEFDKFKSYDLRTTDWLTLLPGQNCPKCNRSVYRRTIHYDGNKIEIIDRCAQFYFDIKPQCNWQKKDIFRRYGARP